MDPAQILQAAVSTEADQDVSSPIWDTLRRQVAVSSIDEWLSVDSRAFLDSIRAKQSDSRRTEKEPLTSSALTDDNGGPLYRPFSILSPQTSPNHSPRRSQSYGDLLSPINSNGDGKLPRSATGNFSTMMTSKPKIHTLPRLQTHLPTTQQPTSPSVWEDFEKNGFPDSPDTVNLTLSPGPVSAPISPVTPMTPFTSSTDCSDLTRSHNHMMASPIELSASCSIAFEDVVELDHLFMSFVEDGQLDPAAVVAWPSFTLVRLKRPVPAGNSPDKPIEWLLVSVENRSAPPVKASKASAQPNIANTSSPEAVPSSSRPNLYGMRDLTGSFRRSSSNGQKSGLRKSILGMSGRSLSKQAGRTDPLPPLSENVGTVQTASVTSESLPRDTPDESGHSIVVPPGASSVRSTSSSQTSGRTSAISDWVYQTEGGAHMIFACRNKSSPYNGQVLRLRKTDIYAENEGIQAEWRESLLSKLVPPCSLARMREVKLEESWVRELWVKAEAAKPKSRKLKDGCLRGAEITSSRAYLMKDLAAGINPAEQTVLCIEIKVRHRVLELDSKADLSRSPNGAFYRHLTFSCLLNLSRPRPSTAVSACTSI